MIRRRWDYRGTYTCYNSVLTFLQERVFKIKKKNDKKQFIMVNHWEKQTQTQLTGTPRQPSGRSCCWTRIKSLKHTVPSTQQLSFRNLSWGNHPGHEPKQGCLPQLFVSWEKNKLGRQHKCPMTVWQLLINYDPTTWCLIDSY